MFPLPAAVGNTTKWSVVPLIPSTLIVSAPVGSPPLTVIVPVRPVGVFGLLQIGLVVARQAVDDQVALIDELHGFLVIDADFAPSRG